jgi:glutamyl-tRNA synthetase
MSEQELKAHIINQVYPEKLPSLAELEEKYPPRKLPPGARVTRVGPSPTGFMHIGTLYTGLLSERFAHHSGGVFFLRIEDTDKKREVEGAADFITQSFAHYDIPIDEGRDVAGSEHGEYGPYTQSDRKEIYHAYVKHLLERDAAYLCFATVEDLDRIRDEQKAQGEIRTGYFGSWALWRDKSLTEVADQLAAGTPYVVRLKATGDYTKKIVIDDLLLGQRELPENDQDIVLMKSDGLPTYHLAHVVDDHLMRTTHVIRGDEWLSSLPVHLQLFRAFNLTPPAYAHIAPINKIENSSKRKLSKRKDPEANIGYFDEQGYHPQALIEYLINLANSNFEDWRKDNPHTPYQEFEVTFDKLRGSNGPLFDFRKLDDISRDIFANLSARELLQQYSTWAGKYDPEFLSVITNNLEYAERILSIERGVPNARKDIRMYQDIKPLIEFFFDDGFALTLEDVRTNLTPLTVSDMRGIVKDFMSGYDATASKEVWFDKLKVVGRSHGFADSTAELKKNPTLYKGGMADVAKIFRYLLTGKIQTPDLYTIMQTMGENRVNKRLSLLFAD